MTEHGAIKNISGQAAYRKGVELASEAAEKISVIEDNDRSLVAVVKGSFDYRTEIHNYRNGLEKSNWDCSCPAADDGSFCKHCVALLLQVVGLPKGRTKKVDAALEKEKQQNELIDYLLDLSKEHLVDLLLNEAKRNEPFQDYLVAKSQSDQGNSLDVKTWKKEITAAFRVRGFLYRGQVGPWAQEIFATLEILESFIVAGHGTEVAELLEHAHKRLETAFNNLDDSNGWLTEISHEIARIHVKACEQSEIANKKLVKRLFALEMDSEFDTFRPVAERYGHILDAEGLSLYRKLLLEVWDSLEKEPDGSFGYGNSRVSSARKALALAEKKPKEFLEVCEISFFFAEDYKSLAQLYLDEGDKRKALEVAYEGMQARPNHQTRCLREFLLEIFRNEGDHEAVLSLLFEQFKKEPSLLAYETILSEAGKNRDIWDQKLQTALLDNDEDEKRNPYLYEQPASVLAQIFMKQQRLTEAWELYERLPFGERVAMQLARESSASFPEKSIEVFDAQASALIEKKNRKSYKQAALLMRRVERIARKADKQELFENMLQKTVEKHHLKRSFIDELRALGWVS